MRYLWMLAVLILGMGGAAHAGWPTTKWTIHEFDGAGGGEPKGEREDIAKKYIETLQHASLWFQLMSFNAPLQSREGALFNFMGEDRYLGLLKPDTSDMVSSHSSGGTMKLSSYPGFLNPKTMVDKLFEASAVHELFHAIQKAHPAYLAYVRSKPEGPPDCDEDESGDHWLTEGTASAIQVQYLEHLAGYSYGHPFKGSPRVPWMRTFDHPLDVPRLPPGQRNTPVVSSTVTGESWQCGYGTWYFWHAVGNMLGSKHPNDARRTAYLRYIFDQKGPWHGTGLALVDSGLSRAAQEMNALSIYRGGLYALYPQFVAQYLDVDAFYDNIESVTMATPSLYETSSLPSSRLLAGGPIEPIATRAWRFKVQLPLETTSMPHTVRFVLESSDPASLEGLHLIVDDQVINRPAGPSIPYSHTRRTDEGVPNSQGQLEYFVRIANVARVAASTLPAEFTLRVEVESFYGVQPPLQLPQSPHLRLSVAETWPSNDAIAAGLPPGFEITGPGNWTCVGGDDARGSFTIITPDGHAEQLERMLPQALKNLGNDLDLAELQAHAESGSEELRRVQRDREAFEHGMQELLKGSRVGDNVALAADDIRRKNETFILAKLYGRSAEGACDVVLNATLPGRQPIAQSLTGDQFSLTVTPESIKAAKSRLQTFALALDPSQFDFSDLTEGNLETKVQQMQKLREQLSGEVVMPDLDWIACSRQDRGCDAGTLRLEHARHGHLSGTFKFRVYRKSDVDESIEYGDVTGFLNITSTQTESDNTLLDFMSRGTQLGEPLYLPGAENFLQGGSLFQK